MRPECAGGGVFAGLKAAVRVAPMIDELINVADFERVAAEKLDAGTAGYFFGGAGDELTLAENVAAWRRWRLRPRALAGLSEWSDRGRPSRSDGLGADPGGPGRLPASGRPRGGAGDGPRRGGGRDGDVPLHAGDARPAEVAAAAPGGRRWFQLYCFRDEGVTEALIDEAVESRIRGDRGHGRRAAGRQPRARPRGPASGSRRRSAFPACRPRSGRSAR